MVKENQSALGKKAVYKQDGLMFDVTIKDVKSAYGLLRYLITPFSGSGEKWVLESSVVIK